ncbi:RHG1A [Symbiodinium natans]|uniref:RING-type E3 ubiquitin transferase n=1 Tax=Symbiodinium natans TaxID=878477 RepID=A0A812U400_9DINO|nr:RHG1A [Symbiodinium natans]
MAEEAEAPEYRVQVDSFEPARRGRHVIYTLIIRRGSAQWPIRRRFRQVVKLHEQLVQGFGRSSMKEGLPRLPPKLTYRSIFCGQQDQRFLQLRAMQLQEYFEALLRYIPYVDQCEALREFLCSVDVSNMSYDALLDLEQALGRGSPGRRIDAALIAALPKRSDRRSEASPSHQSGCCVICQELMLKSEDIRVLPCGHEYHYECISQWIPESNTCCVCHGLAIETPASGDEAEADDC